MLEDSDVGIPGEVEISLAGAPVQPEAVAPKEPVQATPEVTPEPVQTTPPVAPRHDPYLIEMAQNLGVGSLQQILSASPDDLREVVRLASRRQPVQEPAPVADQPEPELFTDDDLKDYDDNSKKLFKTVRELAKEVPALKKENDQLKQYISQQDVRTENQLADDAFAALGAEFVPLIGKGSIKDFQRDDPETMLRNTWHLAVGVKASHPEYRERLQKIANKFRAKFAPVEQTNGKQPPPRERNRLGQYETPPVQEPVGYTPKEWEAGALATATQRKSQAAPKTRFEELIEEVKAERLARSEEPSSDGDPNEWLV